VEARIQAEPNGPTASGTDLTAEVDLSAAPRHTDLHDPAQRLQVENAVSAVPGVMGARLVPGFDRQVDELHVLTTLDKSPKQAVRDVQTVLMARFGIPTDHRVISVVQLDEAEVFPSTSRVMIDQIGLSQSGRTVTAEVTVREGGRTHRGSAQGTASPAGRTRAVAMATLAAVDPLLEDGGALELDGAEIVQVLGRELAISMVTLHDGRSELTLAGSAVVRDTPQHAVARSLLDALNRLLSEAGR
jgi:hypothetical protein